MKRVALITGGASNLGSEVVRKFKDAGFIVYAPTHSEIDITSDSDCKKYVSKVAKTYGRIDVLVNCAGVTPVGPVLEESSTDFLNTLDVNAAGAFRLIKEVADYMPDGGKIINISSLNGIASLPNYGIYSASKHALEAITFALRQELRPKGIWVASVLPGAILNEKKNSLKSPVRTAREKFWILKFLMPFVTADEVAKSVVRVAGQSKPPARVVLGNDARIITFLAKILPFGLWDKLVFYVWNHK